MTNIASHTRIAFLLFVTIYLVSCAGDTRKHLFTKLDASASGISFSNELFDDDSSFSFINEFGYMGGGVGIGDFNNDGLKDIFFTGNQVSCKLYINLGENKFEDITVKAGLVTSDWCTGVSIADVNQDGFDDIYVSVFGKDLKQRSRNLLYINNKNLRFTESAAEYGLADTGYSTQAAFFDYDRDGDLDMYLTNYLLSPNNANVVHPRDRSGFSPANDRLYRNEGDSAGIGHPVFSEQTLSAEIREDGFGLGISVSDFNNDGWPDVYVGNDFISNDLLWQNNKNGSFKNVISVAMRHQSYSSMGTDAADINNDLLPDVVTLDMMPETNERKKTTYSLMNYERYESERLMGYEPEFMRNMLQLNNGNIMTGDTSTPFFSEIGRLAKIQATDWSWSVLLADYNNDGWKDMHITNGIGRDFINADFLEFSNNIYSSNLNNKNIQQTIRQKLASLDNVNLSNYLYLNNKGLQFTDLSEASGIDEKSMSNGAAFADLDNDGDLDLIVNNINKPAFVFINNTIDQAINQDDQKQNPHYLKVRLEGSAANQKGFGAKVILHQKNLVQYLEQNPVRGYFSSVDQDLLFGLGTSTVIDSLHVTWPDGKQQLLTGVQGDTLIILRHANALPAEAKTLPPDQTLFTEITNVNGLAYQHVESAFNDYVSQRLLPQKYSQLGPFITVADIDNDNIEDFFIGGAFNYPGKIFRQDSRQHFVAAPLGEKPKFAEDEGCVFFDADGDGDKDLLVTSGGMQYDSTSSYYRPRLYLNNGRGDFALNPLSIPPEVLTMSGFASVGDYDNDGDPDLFIGSRISSAYPLSPRSYILQNNGGVFTDVTEKICPSLLYPGMLSTALWADYDRDNMVDLILAGEWMPVRFFRNQSGKLNETTSSTGPENMNGMWRSLEAADVDGDGDIDFIAGNLGQNNAYGITPNTPMRLFATDFDNNGSIDPFFFYHIKTNKGEKKLVPGYGRAMFSEQVPALKKRFLLHKDFATVGYDEMFKDVSEQNLQKFYCDETSSCWLENLGNGKFRKHILPVETQFSPINAIVCEDFDGDGIRDLLIAGNEYQADVMTGRYDASYGCLLLGTREKNFIPEPYYKTGFSVEGDVKDMSVIKLAKGGKAVIVAVNNDAMRIFRFALPATHR